MGSSTGGSVDAKHGAPLSRRPPRGPHFLYDESMTSSFPAKICNTVYINSVNHHSICRNMLGCSRACVGGLLFTEKICEYEVLTFPSHNSAVWKNFTSPHRCFENNSTRCRCFCKSKFIVVMWNLPYFWLQTLIYLVGRCTNYQIHILQSARSQVYQRRF